MVWIFVFQLAEKYKLKHNFNKEKKMAGPEWLDSFLKRNPKLSVRTPEGTSMNRAKAFNREAVSKFFDNLEPFTSYPASRVFNVDETGISTVAKSSKIVAARGKKRIGAITSAERGTNTTVICSMSATGIFIPPMFIFKRVRMAPHLLHGAPTGSVGECSESGCVTEPLFLKWLQHFQKETNATEDNPVLLIADNHTSHISLDIWEFLRHNGIQFITIPPHTSHRTQPLDVAFFKPLKTNYGEQVRLWHLQNPGKALVPADVPAIFAKAYTSSCRMQLAQSGFASTGIVPFDREIFTNEDFAAAEFLLPPQEEEHVHEPVASSSQNAATSQQVAPQSPLASTSTGVIAELSPLPRVQTKLQLKRRRSQASVVVNSSPMKDKLMEKAKRKAQRQKPDQRKAGTSDQQPTTSSSVVAKSKGKKRMETAAKPVSDSEESDDSKCIVCFESFSNSRSREVWVQCVTCKHWAHEACTPGYPSYTCHNCNSDSD